MSRSTLRLISLLLSLMLHGTDAKLEIIPGKVEVHVGEEILLMCKATPEGEITWRKDGNTIDDDETVKPIDGLSSSLNIKTATLQDAGTYICECEFDNGHNDIARSMVFVYEGPSFNGTKTYHEFQEGEIGLVPCLVTGKPQVNVLWLRNNEEIPSNPGLRVRHLPNNTLYFAEVKRKDAGTYTCHAEINKSIGQKHLDVSVVVNFPPKVLPKEEVIKVRAGPETNVSLVCLVEGHPTPNITWTMPVAFDPSHHQFNSDRSQLTILSVSRADDGEYVCTANSNIAADNATIVLDVFEAPGVNLSLERQVASVGGQVSVSCNVSGYPLPELHWLNKFNGRTLDLTSGHIRVLDGVMTIEDIVPSDGGIYSCMAVSTSVNASRDFELLTQPGPPLYMAVIPGPTSVHFSLKILPVNGGTPLTNFVLQWRKIGTEKWMEKTVAVSEGAVITGLKPYTQYSVRLAALNSVGVGEFSDIKSVRTLGIREPDSPVLLPKSMKVEKNSVTIPLKQENDGGSPVLYYIVQFKQDKEGAELKEQRLPSTADSVALQDLAFGSDYKLQVVSVNANGSSMPVIMDFSIAEKPQSSTMTKGGVAGVVMVIFLVVFLVVDATCCYRNRCGLLMTIAVKLFGKKIPGLKMAEESNNG
ncbi:neural cell adhesion molecule 1 isoform X2 [Cynoglossus semilaevis]|uniref:neural cell adhesion molecule 1 isoform X2 n=1 Tax=Cynoglossus semilaevis TaxID=244447 RepID=UPI000D631347|nr:neural cell adhesion molecule 1-like isoform X2 [Cynoglossus semilaevis]